MFVRDLCCVQRFQVVRIKRGGVMAQSWKEMSKLEKVAEVVGFFILCIYLIFLFGILRGINYLSFFTVPPPPPTRKFRWWGSPNPSASLTMVTNRTRSLWPSAVWRWSYMATSGRKSHREMMRQSFNSWVIPTLSWISPATIKTMILFILFVSEPYGASARIRS